MRVCVCVEEYNEYELIIRKASWEEYSSNKKKQEEEKYNCK